MVQLNRIIQSQKFFEVVLLSLLDIVLSLYFSSGQHLPLLRSPRLLYLSLQLLLRFTLRVSLGQHLQSPQTVDGLKFNQGLLAIVAETEAGGAIATEGSLESEEDDVLGLPVILVGNQLTQVLLGDVGLALVVYVQQQLLPGQQLIDSQSPGFDGDGHKKIIFIKKSQLLNISPTPDLSPPHFLLPTCLQYYKVYIMLLNITPKISTFFQLLLQHQPITTYSQISHQLRGDHQNQALELESDLSLAYNHFYLMDYSFLMMRHASSKHNLEKDQWKERFGGKSYKKMPEYRLSKFSPDLIDSPQIDLDQCQQVTHKFIDLNNVSLIICSPLKRCLQTCRQITQNNLQHIPVLVEPLLSNRLSAAWSIGSSASVLSKQYPQFDFGALGSNPEGWMVRLLSHLNRYSETQMVERKEGMQDYLLKKVEGGEGETYEQFFERMKKLKGKMEQILSKLKKAQSDRKQILIISHSCVLSFLLGQQLNEKGKVKDKISFQHCLPRKYQIHQVLGPPIQSPEK